MCSFVLDALDFPKVIQGALQLHGYHCYALRAMRISLSTLVLIILCSAITGAVVYQVQQKKINELEQKVEFLGEMVPIPSLPTTNPLGGSN